MDLRMVAPSLVTVTFSLVGPAPVGLRILSMPFGPRVVFTRLATVIAPTKAVTLAISPFSSDAWFLRTFVTRFYVKRGATPMISILRKDLNLILIREANPLWLSQ